MVKEETGGLLSDSHNIMNRWKKCFCQLPNIRGINNVRHTEMHTDEPLVPQPGTY